MCKIPSVAVAMAAEKVETAKVALRDAEKALNALLAKEDIDDRVYECVDSEWGISLPRFWVDADQATIDTLVERVKQRSPRPWKAVGILDANGKPVMTIQLEE